MYDFDRVDAHGATRELHVDLALEAINYNVTETKKEYSKNVNESNVVVDCPYFTTNYIPLNGTITVKKDGKSFTVYMCIDGQFEIEYNDAIYKYKKGDTVLIPAGISELIISGKASILEIYIS